MPRVMRRRRVQDGPVAIGWEDLPPALDAAADDLRAMDARTAAITGGTHWWGTAYVRVLGPSAAEVVPWQVHRGRPCPRAPLLEEE